MIEVKQGDPFFLMIAVTDEDDDPLNITTWTIRSQLRRENQLLQEFLVTKTDPEEGEYTIQLATPNDSIKWPVGVAEMDIEYDFNDEAPSATETIFVNVLKRITERLQK